MIERNELLKEKTHVKEMQNKTTLVLTYNRFLPNIINIVWIYLILAEHFKGYSKKNQLQLLRQIGI